jgi:hypothetical protein
MMLCMDKKYLAIHGIDPDNLQGYIFDGAQPTVHWNVLREAGEDEKKVVIDERSAIYHIAGGRKYPPMLTLCADKDMPNRLEQTMLFLSTLKHFGYTGAEFHLMEGYGHSGYTAEPVFRKTAAEFIIRHSV